MLRRIAFLIPGVLALARPAQAAFTVSISGTPGAGQITLTVSGSETPVNTQSINFMIVADFVPDYLSGGVNAVGISAAGSCSDSDETRNFVAASSFVEDDGGGNNDDLHIGLDVDLVYQAGDPVTCSGTVTFPIDINNVISANLPLQSPFGTNAFNGLTFTLALAGNGSASPNAQDKSNTVAALQSAFNSATPSLLPVLDGIGGNAGNGVTFAPTGFGFAPSHLDSVNPMDREYGYVFAPRGYFDGGQKARSGNGFNFSVNLNQLTQSSAEGSSGETALAALSGDEAKLGYGAGGSKDDIAPPQSRITSFIKGQYVDFDDGQTNADRDGHLWVVTSGLGFRVSPNTTIGLLSRYRSGEADSNALAASLDSDFYGGGAFLTTALGGGLKVAVAGLYEHGDNDIRIGTATGSFDSDHVTLEGRIDKRFERGAFWIEPGVGIRYIDTEQDNYTDSSGTFVTNQDLTLGRFTYGPKIGTTLHRGNAMLKPYAKVNGVWDFDNDGNFATTTAGTFTSADHGLNLGGGIEVNYASGFSIRLAGDWYGYDDDLDVWSLSGGVGAPLSALGLGQVGFVSLDLAANAEDASAQARIRIPLGRAE